MPSIYGTYLCREPSNQSLSPVDDRLEILHRSAEYFSRREQRRAVERLQLEIAQVHIENRQWGNAWKTLVPLWQTISWRREGWWNLLEKVNWALRECARFVGDGETLVAVEWELLHSSLRTNSEKRCEFSECLDGLELSHPSPKAVIQAEDVISCMSATFAFGPREGHVGESLPAQLVITSYAHTDSAPVTISLIKLTFNGGLQDINIQHDFNGRPETTSFDELVHLYKVPLHKAPTHKDNSVPSSPVSLPDAKSLFGSSNLSFSVGVTKAFSIINLPRDAGIVEAASIILYLKEALFELEFIVSDEQQLHQENLWVTSARGPSKKELGKERSNIVKILPKPPKMRIEVLDLMKPYLTDEIVSFSVRLINEEGDNADVSLEIRLHDQSEMAPGLNWAFEGRKFECSKTLANNEIGQSPRGGLLATSLGEMAPFDTRIRKISLQAVSQAAQYGLEVTARYHLLSDPETPISKTLVTSVVFIRPFEAHYSFFPRILPGPWPNYFHADDSSDTADSVVDKDSEAAGLSQRWLLTTGMTSFAAEPILVESVELRMLDTRDRVRCKIEPTLGSRKIASLMPPDGFQERQFELDVQKIDLDDRRSTVLSLQLEVRWRRQSSENAIPTTTMYVPDLVVPFGEPRVLASARKGQGDDGLVYLDYMIENPSMHVLTFKLSMEPSDSFAFSGAKDSLLQLVPLSRHSIQYNILPLVKGTWISPQFKVMDIHFRKTLKVNATAGMSADKKSALIWVDAEG